MVERLRRHGLSIFFGVIFLAALFGQSVAGLVAFNEEQSAHAAPASSWWDFLRSPSFVVDVAENWQSEFLQFFLFILATIWLVQVGSPESKKLGNQGVGTDQEQLVGAYSRPDSPRWARAGGWRTVLYSNSLLLAMGAIFLGSWLVQSMAGLLVYNNEQSQHAQPIVGWTEYISSAEFWNRTLQNWRSEFLAVGCMVAFSIFLRQRGSAESKPVGAPHSEASVGNE